jgi:dihydrodipicolinate synthase/N-acetylneuraminate lyase
MSTAAFDANNYKTLFVASVTPLDADDSIDEPGLRKLLDYFVAARARSPQFGVIVNPEAGEIFYMNADEQQKITDITLDHIGGAMPVFTGVLGNTTKETVKIAVRAAASGVNGLFLMPPIGAMDVTTAWDPTGYPEIWGDLIAAVVDAVPDKPIICHPVATPSAGYGVGLPLEPTLALLQQFPQIVGWKMTYNYEGHRKLSRRIRQLDHQVNLLGATAVNFHENLATGNFDGTVTGSLNYALEPMLDHIDAWRHGDLERANAIWNGGLAELHEFVYETWGRLHIRYKTATWLRGVIGSPFMRPPMPKPRKAEVETLYKLLTRMDVSVVEEYEVGKLVAMLPC